MLNRLRGPGGAVALLVVVTGAYLVATMPGRGVYWDEYVQSEYGRNVVNWYASGFSDHSALEQTETIFYGGIVEASLELAAIAVPFDRYLIRHLGVGLFALVGLVGAYRLGEAMRTPWTGVLAAVLLALSPRFFGHAFFNSKDIPFAALYLWTLVLFVRDVRRPIGAPLGTVWPLMLGTGLLLGARIGGAIVLAPILLGYARWWWINGRTRVSFVQVVARFGAVFVGAWAIMLIGWPWALQRPFLHPMTALFFTGAYPIGTEQLFAGRFVNSLVLPPSYLPTWFAISTPEIVLLGLIGLLVVGALRPRRSMRTMMEPGVLSVIVATALPPAYVMVRSVTLYDGPRHLLFIQPLIAVAAAVGIMGVWTALGGLWGARWSRPGVALVGFILAWLPLSSAWTMRPYEYVYFNHASGGLASAEGRYELDYFGLSYREGVETIAETNGQASIRVASCSHPMSAAPFVNPPLEYVGSALFQLYGPADILLYTALHDCSWDLPWEPPEGPVVHVVQRQGVPLLSMIRPDTPYRGIPEAAAAPPY